MLSVCVNCIKIGFQVSGALTCSKIGSSTVAAAVTAVADDLIHTRARVHVAAAAGWWACH